MRIGTRLSLMAVGAVCIILIIGVTSYISVSNLIAANQLFSHSREVLQELNMLLYNLSDTVGTQRAYMITGQEIYYDAYKALVASTNESMQKIRQLVSDNPVQSLRVDKLGVLVKERLASLEVTNELYQTKGTEPAFYRVRTGNSVKFRISLHKAIDEIKSCEVDLLQKREKDLKRSAASTQLTIVAGSCLGLILITLFSYLFARYMLNSIGQLIRAVDNIRYNRFDLTVPNNSNDEFGDLSSAFNSVGQQLLVLSNKLSQRENEIATLMDNMETKEKESSPTIAAKLFKRFSETVQSSDRYTASLQKSFSNVGANLENVLKSWQELSHKNNGKAVAADAEPETSYKGSDI